MTTLFKARNLRLPLTILWLIPVFLVAQPKYFPGKAEQWQTKTAQAAGINPNGLKRAVDFAMTNEYSGPRDLRIAILESFSREPFHEIVGPTRPRGGPAGMIIRQGYVIAQWGDVDRVDMTFSVTKSYLSTVAGLALQKGLIKNVNEKAGAYVWDGTFDGEHNSNITWHHLLTQSSDWSGTLFGIHDWADRPPREGGIDDWRNRELKKPRSSFKYNDVRVNVLAYALLQVWRKPLPMVLKEEIMDPIGATSTWRWYGYENSWVTIDGIKMQSVSGGGHHGGGLFISTTDQARFGLLFLRNGNWNGKQLISENWAKAIQQSSEANASCGYMWWINKGNNKWSGVPESVYYAAGFGGNYIVIDTARDLLIVTRWLEPSKIGEMVKLVIDSVEK